MSGFIQDLERLRPFAYHTSGQINFDSIRRDGQIRSTHDLLSGTPYDYLLATRRKAAQVVQLANGPVEIRHHLPLRPGSMAHEPGGTLDSYVQLLNARAFFWVGTDAAPVRTGRGHFDYCRSQGAVFVIRAPLSDLIGLNPKGRLHVTRCNSGSARHHSGKPVPRGPRVFATPETAHFPASETVEITFLQLAYLPRSSEFSASIDGPWRALWPAT